MRRSALRVFFSRVLPIALPLAAACGCPSSAAKTITIPTSDIPDGGLTDMDCARICEAYTGFDNISYCASASSGGLDADAGWVEYDCRGLRLCSGRRPALFKSTEPEAYAQLAELEAASVGAFRILRNELQAHRAPTRLIRDAERAALDEIRHAQIMFALAGLPPRTWAQPALSPDRTLEEIGLENAREGCVREALGAALGQLESRTATSKQMRRAMAFIFPDEERHAELAFAVDNWLRSQLPARAHRRLDDALRSALAELETELKKPAERALLKGLSEAISRN
jgi:hypothetical protein